MRKGTAPGDAGPQGALDELGSVFGDRIKQDPSREALTLVLPRTADEVVELSKVAARRSLTLLAQGAGTGGGDTEPGNAVLIRFDLMGSVRLAEDGRSWAEAGPGATLLSLENNLGARGLGPAVYPTSAPRATVGGWLAGEGIGVGSFEYGRLPENVLSAEVVLSDGERRTLPGLELPEVLRENPSWLLTGARLRTRPAGDMPFAVGFGDLEDLAAAAARLAEAGVPLWHLAFANAAMSRARNLGGRPLLFGAYPRERSAAVEDALAATVEEHSGLALSAADAHRVWGQRFFPVVPPQPTPGAERREVPLAGVPIALQAEERPVQGTVSRSGEVLLLALTHGPGGSR